MARSDPAPRGAKFIILASICVMIAALWFMQDVLIPLALAILVTFLFTPVVHRLERWGIGRIGSVITVITLTVVVILSLGYIAFGQVLTLATDLPKYQDEIVAKISKLRPSRGGVGVELVDPRVRRHQRPRRVDLAAGQAREEVLHRARPGVAGRGERRS